ncbi:hypothetical protein pipiens_005556 [Culex pipiens pipiens]|uniref:Uncharacterized protein n=1 Tax=Culex pipiens pipiens TaxID=38569 RepID=A0ABD1D4L8_CULPP
MLQDMVMSKSQTDVYEAIDFFTSAYLFGIKGTESGMQQNEQFQCRAMELVLRENPPDFDEKYLFRFVIPTPAATNKDAFLATDSLGESRIVWTCSCAF